MRSDPPEVRNKYEDMMNKTASQAQLYDNNVKKKIILTENALIEKYPYATTKLKGLVNPLHYGFTDAYFGGNIDNCAIVAGEPYVILVNKNLETIGIYIPDENLDQMKLQELRDLCAKYAIKYKMDDTKAVLIEMLTK